MAASTLSWGDVDDSTTASELAGETTPTTATTAATTTTTAEADTDDSDTESVATTATATDTDSVAAGSEDQSVAAVADALATTTVSTAADHEEATSAPTAATTALETAETTTETETETETATATAAATVAEALTETAAATTTEEEATPVPAATTISVAADTVSQPTAAAAAPATIAAVTEVEPVVPAETVDAPTEPAVDASVEVTHTTEATATVSTPVVTAVAADIAVAATVPKVAVAATPVIVAPVAAATTAATVPAVAVPEATVVAAAVPTAAAAAKPFVPSTTAKAFEPVVTAPATTPTAAPTAAAASATTAEEEEEEAEEAESSLHPNDATAEVQVVGGTSIYKAAETFESLNLSPQLLRGVYDLKFTSPSKIQAQSLPIIMHADAVTGAYSNVIGQAQHGSGKTAAFCLGLLSRIDQHNRGNNSSSNSNSRLKPQAVVVTPTRELAYQITVVARKLCQFMYPNNPDAVATLVPQSCYADGITPIGAGDDIAAAVVVGTPGTIKQRIEKRSLNVSAVLVFVADEADQMVDTADSGLGDQTIAIRMKMPRKCQVLLFSATFDNAQTIAFAERVAPAAVKILIKTEELSLDGIKQFYVDVNVNSSNSNNNNNNRNYSNNNNSSANKEQQAVAKYDAFVNIFGFSSDIGATIVFVATVATAKWLTNRLRGDAFAVSLLHGKDMLPAQRDTIMSEFRRGLTSVLITTNVLSRGIDVDHVTLVINYDLPLTRHHQPDFSAYIHRIGRSGRFGRKGVAINFVHDSSSKRTMEAIAQHFGKQVDVDVKRLPIVDDVEAAMAMVTQALKK